ncbi:phosphoribosyl-AMP cyclohydrolase [Stetteria hydrogenophila]
MEPGGCRVDYSKLNGLVPVIVVDAASGAVLTQAYANREAVEATLRTGYAHFYSRSRRRLWMKGETSGNRLRVLSVTGDCDCDSLIYLAVPEGPACHTGMWTCFHNPLADTGFTATLWRLLTEALRASRLHSDPRGGYRLEGPLTTYEPPPSPLLLSLLATALLGRAGVPGRGGRGADLLAAPEGPEALVAAAIASRAGIPLQPVGPGRPPSSVAGREVLVYASIVSGGRRLQGILEALESQGARVKAVLAPLAVPSEGGPERLERAGYRLERLADLHFKTGGIAVLVNPETGERVEVSLWTG